MNTATCLNCNASLQGNYCHNCGQKAATHRLSLGHFIAHDMLHGIWHLEKGMLFTLKELLVRPGATAKAYIEGKRVRYYSFLTLLLICTGIALYINHLIPDVPEPEVHKKAYDVMDFLGEHLKVFLIMMIPLLALPSMLMLGRLKYNFTEHMIAPLIIILDFVILDVLSTSFDWLTGTDIVSAYLETAACLLLLFYTYWQLSRGMYTLGGILWRVIVILALMAVFFFIIVYLIHRVIKLFRAH